MCYYANICKIKNGKHYFWPKKEMQLNIRIHPDSPVPKYLQIVNGITELVLKKKLLDGNRLPTINELSKDLHVGRVTVVNAYEELKERGIIDSTHGKGFFIKNPSKAQQKRVFLLFDAMNGYKEVLYRSLVQELGPRYNINIYFYYYNYREFCRYIEASTGNYDHYVILPHFNFDVAQPLSHLPRQKLLLLDKDVESLKIGYAGIFQNFYSGTMDALSAGLYLIRKYRKINLVLQEQFQFIPTGIIEGFKDFCRNSNLDYEIVEDLHPENIKSGEIYFVISDIDLINVVRTGKRNGFTLGKDLGLISFDDTPLKNVLADGITTISTDFARMGKTAAQMIRKGVLKKQECPLNLIIRNSL
jgi:DNA-binding transcriptional regulator YhcF (GntR family)